MSELPYCLLSMPPNLNIYCPANEAAAELALGVFNGAIRVQVMVCRSNT